MHQRSQVVLAQARHNAGQHHSPSIPMWTALKIMPPLLLRQSTTSEADVWGIAAEVEPSHQYFITCCRHVTVASRGAVWQNGIWSESAHEARVCHWIPPCGKKMHSLAFINACWMLIETKQWMWAQWGGVWCISAVVTAGHLCLCWFLWARHAGYCSSWTKIHR